MFLSMWMYPHDRQQTTSNLDSSYERRVLVMEGHPKAMSQKLGQTDLQSLLGNVLLELRVHRRLDLTEPKCPEGSEDGCSEEASVVSPEWLERPCTDPIHDHERS